MDSMDQALAAGHSVAGLTALIGIAWLLSEDRSRIKWSMVGAAVGLQIALAFCFLQVPAARGLLQGMTHMVSALQQASLDGARFVFGFVSAGTPPFEIVNPEAYQISLAFQILPLVIFIAALSALLWHWRILPMITRGFAWGLERTLGIGGPAGLATAANVFMGMIEAPLFIRAYLSAITRSEMFLIMSVGLATVSGTVLVLYATTLEPVVPGAIAHILTASIISLPAAILVAKVMIPGDEVTGSRVGLEILSYNSSMDAVVEGTQEGLKLFLTIIAMLIVVVALVSLADKILALVPDLWGAPLTMERIFGWLFAPLVFLFGVPWSEAPVAGSLMGTKTILNELIAYFNMAALDPGALSDRSKVIMIYALCGFANLSSVGILISTLSALIPERRSEILGLSMRSLVAGTLATGMTGTVAGLLTLA